MLEHPIKPQRSGMLTFHSLAAAIAAGFQVEDPYQPQIGEIVVRTQTPSGWLRALVIPEDK